MLIFFTLINSIQFSPNQFVSTSLQWKQNDKLGKLPNSLAFARKLLECILHASSFVYKIMIPLLTSLCPAFAVFLETIHIRYALSLPQRPHSNLIISVQ